MRTVGEVESPVSSMNEGVGGSVLEGNAEEEQVWQVNTQCT